MTGPGGPDVFVVVRAAGERTEAACAALAAAEVGKDHVKTIHEVPFSEAVRRGFEIGRDAGRGWTLCLDADVLLRPGAIAALTAAGDAALARDPGLFEIEGVVADKLLGQVRGAGQHLYRTEHLTKALEIGSFDAKKRRPETVVKKQMEGAGHPWEACDVMMGLHDFEQSYVDIFRTVFTHTRKHARFMPYAERYWERLAPDDADLRVALWSMKVAHAIDAAMPPYEGRVNENVAIDKRHFPSNLDTLLVPARMAEKEALPGGAITGATVEDAIGAFEVAPEFEAYRAGLADA